MTDEEIRLEVFAIIAEKIWGCEEITEEMDMYNDVGADSLDFTDIVMTCESNLGITIDNDEAMGITTVGALVKLCTEKVHELQGM